MWRRQPRNCWAGAKLLRRTQISDLIAQGDTSIFEAMFASLREAISVRDPYGEIVYANTASLVQLGFESLEQLRGRAAETVLDAYIVEDADGNPILYEQLPGVRLVRERAEVPPLTLRMVARGTGELQWWRVTASALHDADGEFLGAMSLTEDVTAIKTAEIQMRALAESGRILASSLDYGQTLRNVAEVAVLLSDYCSVDLLDERGAMRRVAAAHRDPGRQPLMAELGSLMPVVLDPIHPVMRVLGSNLPELFESMDDTQVAAVSRDPEHLELLRALGVRSMLIVPLRVPSRTIGVLTMATDVSRRRLSEDDVSLAEQLGRRAAVAVENSRLHTTLSGIAETLQTSLLPTPLPQVPGWDLASLYKPAATEFRVDVGGDFYEVFDVDGEWFAILGDVTGKGVSAASVTALMRHGARVAAQAEPEPAAILSRLDQVLAEQPKRAMATALCVHIHPDRLLISSAGHPPAVIVSSDGRLREFPKPDPMLGAFDGVARRAHSIAISASDLVVIYTDGVPDARSVSGRFGHERVMRVLSSTAGESPAEALADLDAALVSFGADAAGDDVAALALRRSQG